MSALTSNATSTIPTYNGSEPKNRPMINARRSDIEPLRRSKKSIRPTVLRTSAISMPRDTRKKRLSDLIRNLEPDSEEDGHSLPNVTAGVAIMNVSDFLPFVMQKYLLIFTRTLHRKMINEFLHSWLMTQVLYSPTMALRLLKHNYLLHDIIQNHINDPKTTPFTPQSYEHPRHPFIGRQRKEELKGFPILFEIVNLMPKKNGICALVLSSAQSRIPCDRSPTHNRQRGRFQRSSLGPRRHRSISALKILS
jgi:hypothetical protein